MQLAKQLRLLVFFFINLYVWCKNFINFNVSYHKILLQKRFPLKISRFVSASCYNVFVRVEKDGIVGWGESVPGEKGAKMQNR